MTSDLPLRGLIKWPLAHFKPSWHHFQPNLKFTNNRFHFCLLLLALSMTYRNGSFFKLFKGSAWKAPLNVFTPSLCHLTALWLGTIWLYGPWNWGLLIRQPNWSVMNHNQCIINVRTMTVILLHLNIKIAFFLGFLSSCSRRSDLLDILQELCTELPQLRHFLRLSGVNDALEVYLLLSCDWITPRFDV